ncbi:hypothetical protein RHSIM_Rhsim01G0120800 [Rhododendron simsii]|uniref:Beta-amyrin synthase n=1 Tax=Rhododendron simsii TaxID=118357 RepID=A0A834HHS9_RHOSS|nr:hypothetical protein RHSIM_Rhsim01G0120800 [Rhododendron simsii]
MWRLKVAEGGGPYEPYLYSTNNFVGRQIWEFDPDYGTPEEHAQVENARQLFTLNRSRVKPNADLLLQFQVCLQLALYSSDFSMGALFDSERPDSKLRQRLPFL